MNNEVMKEVLNELFSHLEKLETQNEAILQFLKEKKRVTDRQLAPYLEQAGNASNVRWRAARVRIEHLLTPEHPEEEVKLGRAPEFHDEAAASRKSEDQRKQAGEKEPGEQKPKEAREETLKQAKPDDQSKPGDQTQAAPAAASQGPAKDDKAQEASERKASERKPVEKPDVEQNSSAQPAQGQSEQKSESVHHPTEMTEPLARQEGAEPAAELNAKEKGSEAA